MVRWTGLATGIGLLFLAFLDLWFANYTFVPPAAIVGGIVSGSPAAAAGLKAGDAIAAVNGIEIFTFDELLEMADETPAGSPLYLTTYRDGLDMGRATLIRPATDSQANEVPGYWAGIDPPYRTFIGAIAPNHPAERAGLMRGDEIVAVNGQEVQFFSELSQITAEAAGEVELTALRGDRELRVKVTPVEVELRSPDGSPFLGPDGQPLQKKLIGIALDPTRYLYAPVTKGSALVTAASQVAAAPFRIFRTVAELTGARPPDPTRDRTGLIVLGAGTILALAGWLTFLVGIIMVFVLKPRADT